MEIELKLSIAPADVRRLRRLPLLKKYAAAAPQARQLTSIYFDTPDLIIRRHNAGLRVRQSGDAWVQTLKGGGSVAGGLHQRHEWETPVEGPHPDLVALRKKVDAAPWDKLLASPTLRQDLRPLFTTRIQRSLWLLRLPVDNGMVEIEFALDEGSVAHDDKQIPVCEVELELKSGAPEYLFDLALQLLDKVPLRLDNVSKAARGYALAQTQPPVASKAASLKLARGMTVEQGYRVILANCIEQLQSNEAGVLALDDAESVHQMRVALRRMQTAFKLFRKAIPCPDEIRDELRWLAGELGHARDWDVLCGAILPQLDALHADLPLDSLATAAQAISRQQHETAAAAVGSVRYTRVLLMLSGWLLGARWRNAESTQPAASAVDASLGKFARKVLMRSQRRLLRRGARLTHDDAPGTRHRLRIAAKHIRYATEFFQSRYAARDVRRYLNALIALQDELGWRNDAVIAGGLLQSLNASLAGDAGFVCGYLAALTEGDARRLRKRWRRLARLKPPFAK